MTAKELRHLVGCVNHDTQKEEGYRFARCYWEGYRFARWYWDEYLSEEQKDKLRTVFKTQDIRDAVALLDDEELMFLYAVHLM